MMVSRYDDERFLLALQIEHSRVAGCLAAHWGNAEFAEPTPYTSVVLAAQEHDNGWWEWETKPTLNNQGHPLDYITDGSLKYLGKFRLDFYKNGVARVIERDAYAGLIVLMHGIGLQNSGYGLLTFIPDRSKEPLVAEYISHQEEVRGKLLDVLRRSEEFRDFSSDEQIWINYKRMQAFDSLAQFICNRYPLNSQDRQNGPSTTLSGIPVPVGPGKNDVTLNVDVLDETRAVIHPYPFDNDPLEVSFPALLVPIRQYESQEDFLRVYYKAERISVRYTLHSNVP